ncbi:GcrA family cell cycle regulator [Phenylobacterium sp.]|uniref:GcrA family cell cycle regulator n=1 Tax=Phenylobacterium sp. TaxID=1871053 RepID=UPI003BAD0476
MTDLSPPSVGWTDDRVERLRALWRDGQSATTVARALGVTRNAVIGKVYRLGLSGDGRHAAAQAPPPKAARRREPQPARSRAAAPPPRPAAMVGLEPLVGLAPRLELLGAHVCQWPIGDPHAEDFAFCGRRAPTGPYCALHDAIAHGRGVREAA